MCHEILQCTSLKFTKLLKGKWRRTTGVLVMLVREEQDSYCCGWTTNTSVLNLPTFSLISSHSVRLSGRITVCCPLAAAARTKSTTKHCILPSPRDFVTGKSPRGCTKPRLFIRRRTTRSSVKIHLCTYMKHFDPGAYLTVKFSGAKVCSCSRDRVDFLLKCLHESFADLKKSTLKVIDLGEGLGSGPAIYSAIKCRSSHLRDKLVLSDIVEGNRDAINKWLKIILMPCTTGLIPTLLKPVNLLRQ